MKSERMKRLVLVTEQFQPVSVMPCSYACVKGLTEKSLIILSALKPVQPRHFLLFSSKVMMGASLKAGQLLKYITYLPHTLHTYLDMNRGCHVRISIRLKQSFSFSTYWKTNKQRKLVSMLLFTFPQNIKLVSWCFKPSQPQRITSGLKKNTHKTKTKTTKNAQ